MFRSGSIARASRSLLAVVATAGGGLRARDRRRVHHRRRLQSERNALLRLIAAGRLLHDPGLRRDVVPGGGGLHPLLPGAVPDEAVRSAGADDPAVCAADEFCLDAGLCAPLSKELRYCVKTCSSNDDCRGGYECRLAGTRGSMALTSNPSADRALLRAQVRRLPPPAEARGSRPRRGKPDSHPRPTERATSIAPPRRERGMRRVMPCSSPAWSAGARPRAPPRPSTASSTSTPPSPACWACCRASARRRPPRSSPTGSGIRSAPSTSWCASSGIGRKMVRRLRVHLAVAGPTTAAGVVAPTAVAAAATAAAATAASARRRPGRRVRPCPRRPSRTRTAAPTHGVCRRVQP